MTRPSNGLTPNNWGNGKAKNVNIDMQGVVDWGTFMDIMESNEETVESERKMEGPLDTTIPTAVEGSREGSEPTIAKWILLGQARQSLPQRRPNSQN